MPDDNDITLADFVLDPNVDVAKSTDASLIK